MENWKEIERLIVLAKERAHKEHGPINKKTIIVTIWDDNDIQVECRIGGPFDYVLAALLLHDNDIQVECRIGDIDAGRINSSFSKKSKGDETHFTSRKIQS